MPELTPAADAYATIDTFWANSGGNYVVPVDVEAIAARKGVDYFGNLDRMELATVLGRTEARHRGLLGDDLTLYAERYAAALVMPRIEVERLSDDLPIGRLANRFGVTATELEHRLYNLGLLPQDRNHTSR